MTHGVPQAPPPRYAPSAVLKGTPLASLSAGVSFMSGAPAPSVADTVATGVTLGAYGCPVCMERYVDLRIACGHCFCSMCWDAWAMTCRDRELHCPTCRMPVHAGQIARFVPCSM